jgi:hypothetical protein
MHPLAAVVSKSNAPLKYEGAAPAVAQMRSAASKFPRHRLKIAVGWSSFPCGALRPATLNGAAPNFIPPSSPG